MPISSWPASGRPWPDLTGKLDLWPKKDILKRATSVHALTRKSKMQSMVICYDVEFPNVHRDGCTVADPCHLVDRTAFWR